TWGTQARPAGGGAAAAGRNRGLPAGDAVDDLPERHVAIPGGIVRAAVRAHTLPRLLAATRPPHRSLRELRGAVHRAHDRVRGAGVVAAPTDLAVAVAAAGGGAWQ